MGFIDWLHRFDRGINRDESVLFYPSYGFKNTDDTWRLQIRGVIFEDRILLKHLPQLALKLTGMASTSQLYTWMGPLTEHVDVIPYFKERTKAFLVDGESHECFSIHLLGQTHQIGTSDSRGYIEDHITPPYG